MTALLNAVVAALLSLAATVSATQPAARVAETVGPPAPTDPPFTPTGRCAEWEQTALDAGWTLEQWPPLDFIIYRESRCVPTATHLNANGSTDYCLLQINSIHRGWIAQDFGASMSDLLADPGLCLRVGHALYEQDGWAPWRT